jgi:hypothetical protein
MLYITAPEMGHWAWEGRCFSSILKCFSFMLTIDKILSILENDNDMLDADIFMEPLENAEARGR